MGPIPSFSELRNRLAHGVVGEILAEFRPREQAIALVDQLFVEFGGQFIHKYLPPLARRLIQERPSSPPLERHSRMRSQSVHLFFHYLDRVSNLRSQYFIGTLAYVVDAVVGGDGGVCTVVFVVVTSSYDVVEVGSGSCRDAVEVELSGGDADMEEGNGEKSRGALDEKKHQKENSRWDGYRSSQEEMNQTRFFGHPSSCCGSISHKGDGHAGSCDWLASPRRPLRFASSFLAGEAHVTFLSLNMGSRCPD